MTTRPGVEGQVEFWDVKTPRIVGRFPGRYCFHDDQGLQVLREAELQMDAYVQPLSPSVTDFRAYPEFVIIGDPVSYVTFSPSEVIEWKNFARVSLPGKLVAARIVAPGSGRAIIPLYFPDEDKTRFVPYDRDALIQKSCRYLREIGRKVDPVICP